MRYNYECNELLFYKTVRTGVGSTYTHLTQPTEVTADWADTDSIMSSPSTCALVGHQLGAFDSQFRLGPVLLSNSEAMMNKKAVIYIRVSTDEQAEKGYSLPSQLDACRRYASEHEYIVSKEFSDDYSGREIQRPGLNALRQYIGTSKVDALIVYSGDRLTRDLAHSIELRREFSLLNVEICKVLGGQVDDSPHGRFTENVISAVSQLESEMIIERTQRGKNQRAKSGQLILQGYPPYGYKKTGSGRDAKMIFDEHQVLIVKKIFQWFIDGDEYSGPMALRAIATNLNKIAAPTPNKCKKSVPYWNPFTVRKILTNEIYAGRTYWGKSRVVNKKRLNGNCRGAPQMWGVK